MSEKPAEEKAKSRAFTPAGWIAVVALGALLGAVCWYAVDAWYSVPDRMSGNGYAAMAHLAQSSGMLEMGITQITEIMANRSVTLVGPLPPELQNIAVYSVGLATHSAHPERSKEFIRRLTGFNAHVVLSAAGFDVG